MTRWRKAYGHKIIASRFNEEKIEDLTEGGI